MAGQLPCLEINVAVLPRAGFPVRLRADGAERQLVAEACGVNRIDRLEADLDLLRWRGGGVEIRGSVRATLEQDCVVTLEPLIQEIDQKIEATFLPEGSKLARKARRHAQEIVVDPEGPDAPETFGGDVIDVWPVVVEFLVLAIDPFPRSPGARLEAELAGTNEADIQSPFAVLKELKKDRS